MFPPLHALWWYYGALSAYFHKQLKLSFTVYVEWTANQLPLAWVRLGQTVAKETQAAFMSVPAVKLADLHIFIERRHCQSQCNGNLAAKEENQIRTGWGDYMVTLSEFPVSCTVNLSIIWGKLAHGSWMMNWGGKTDGSGTVCHMSKDVSKESMSVIYPGVIKTSSKTSTHCLYHLSSIGWWKACS